MADEAILRVILEGERATGTVVPTQVAPPAPPVITPPAPITQLRPPAPQTQLAPSRPTQLAPAGSAGASGQPQRTWYQVYIVAPLPLPVTVTNWVAQRVREPRPEKVPTVEPEQSDLSKYAASFITPAAIATAVTAALLGMINVINKLNQFIGSTVVAVAQFGVALLSASTDVSQLPQIIGQAIAGIGKFVEEIGLATARTGAVVAGFGVFIALLAGASGVGIVIGVVIAAIGLLMVAIGALGATFGALGKYAGELIKVFASAMREINQTAEKYAQYNPQLAVAVAMADVRETLGDMRRAQQAGPDLAQFITAQSHLQQRYEDIKVKFLQMILPFMDKGMEKLEAILIFVQNFIDSVKMSGWAGAMAAIKDTAEASATMAAMMKHARDAEPVLGPEFLDEIMGTINQQFGNLND